MRSSLRKSKKPKTKWAKKAKCISVPLFESHIWYFKNQNDLNSAAKALGKKKYKPLVDGLTWHFVSKKDKHPYFFIGVFDKQKSTLIHELGHLTFHLLKFYGIPLEKKKWPSNEIYCYLLAALYQEIMKKVKLEG